MEDEKEQSLTKDSDRGFLVRKFKAGDCFIIGDDIEIRVGRTSRTKVSIAIRAPKSLAIRRIEKEEPSKA